MSGRDLRQFLSQHAGSFNAKPLNSQVVNSYATGSQRHHGLKGADYDKMDALVEQFRQSGEKRIGKMESLSKKNAASKETMLLKQHRMFWVKEREDLNVQLRKIEFEMESLYGTAILASEKRECFLSSSEIWKSVVETEGELITRRESFRSEHVQPMVDLRNKIKTFCKLQLGRSPAVTGDSDSMRKLQLEVCEVKKQQRTVQESLEKALQEAQEDLLLVQASLSLECVQMFPKVADTERIRRLAGIPEDVHDMECPSEDMRASVVSQFEQLNNYHQTVLSGLDETYRDELGAPFGGWSEDDHDRFCLILQQYPPEIPGKRKLYLDRLRRELSSKSRTDILSHEKWIESLHFYKQRREACFRAWSRDKDDLLLRVRVLFRDAMEEEAAVTKWEKEKENQEKICHELHKRLSYWMEQKLEAMRLEAGIAEMLQKEEQRKREVLEAREKKYREHNKKNLEAYRIEKEMKQQKMLEEKQKKLLEIKRALSEQAQHDRERVEYRSEQRLKMLEEKQVKESRSQQAEIERQHRLEVLRQQVRVEAPVDPLRLLRETKSYHSRVLSEQQETDKELELQTPLFSQHGFTDHQINSDKRIRVEEALRKAGLHGSEYARKILASVPPPTEPRKDQQSTVFKTTQ